MNRLTLRSFSQALVTLSTVPSLALACAELSYDIHTFQSFNGDF